MYVWWKGFQNKPLAFSRGDYTADVGPVFAIAVFCSNLENVSCLASTSFLLKTNLRVRRFVGSEVLCCLLLVVVRLPLYIGGR